MKKQKLKEIHGKLKNWSKEKGDQELEDCLHELVQALDADDDGSNPPGGPKNPPGTGNTA